MVSSVLVGGGPCGPGGLEAEGRASATIYVVISFSAAESTVSLSASAEWASLAAGILRYPRGRRTQGGGAPRSAWESARYWLRVMTFAETTLLQRRRRFSAWGSRRKESLSKTDCLRGISAVEESDLSFGSPFEPAIAVVCALRGLSFCGWRDPWLASVSPGTRWLFLPEGVLPRHGLAEAWPVARGFTPLRSEGTKVGRALRPADLAWAAGWDGSRGML